MIFKPKRLGEASLPDDQLREDKKHCKKFGPCGVGKKAIYLNSFYIDRMYYIPMQSVKRIFKRVAMSKGGFTGKGIFGSMPYLVVVYENGLEKQCNFKHEEDVDRLLAHIEKTWPDLPTHSVEAERKLREKAQRLAELERKRVITDEIRQKVEDLERAKTYLSRQDELYQELSLSANKKRTYDRTNPAYKWVALAVTLLGAAALLYGVYSLITRAGFGVYFLLFGLAAIFFFSGVNVLPTAKNNRRYVENHLHQSIEAMQAYIQAYPEFPVPAHYAHPIVLKRMQDILKDKRAKTVPEALEVLKADLKAMNSSVMVEQEEYDEIVAIKPMFLVMDYR